MRLRFLAITILPIAVFLASCGVDTTGLSDKSSRGSHPQTNSGAAVTVIEYGDLQCPACGSAYPLIVQPLIQKYGKQINFQFMHFPLMTIHPYALAEAEASECAADQGKFWEFVDLAYTKQSDLSAAAPREWARQLGLDLSLFDRCTQSHIKRSEILADESQGKKADVQGTPTFFVNGQIVENDINTLSTAIDTALKAATNRL